jgi:two-component system response regulator RegA
VTPDDPSPALLLVEDDADFRATLQLEFGEKGYAVSESATLAEVQTLLEKQIFRFAVVDLRLQGDWGLDVVSTIRTTQPGCRTVVLTGYGSISTAVEAIKRGAVNYLTKPVSLERLEKALWVDLPPGEEDPDEPIESLERHEREYLEYVLARCGGNISKAARWLNLHRQSLQRKLRQTGLK